jgi:predicted O-linked N-acetylglucosamine transferase (SPINDLY family)
MPTLAEALAVAIAHHQAGRLDLAEEIYRRILQAEPAHGDALHLLGLIARKRGQPALAIEHIHRAVAACPTRALYHQSLGNIFRDLGQLDPAAACYRRALELTPDYPEAYNNLADTLAAQGKPTEAVACYRRAVDLRPDYAVAWNNLGNALLAQRQADEAIACYRRALTLLPDCIEACNNLGTALHGLGRYEEALGYYQQALARRPDHADVLYNRANALKELGRVGEAIADYRRALQFRPTHAQAHNNLGLALHSIGQLDEAVACYRRALELAPRYVQAYNNLGTSLLAQKQTDAAIGCYRRALELDPDSAEAHNNLGNALLAQGKPDEARASCARAVAIRPAFPEAHNNLAAALHSLGRFDEAIASYQRAIELQPTAANIHSAMLGVLSYSEHATLKGLAELHAAFERQHGAHLRALWPAHHNPPDPRRRLRVGFVSADLTNHPVGYFLIPVLEHLDANEVHTFCYFARPGKDAMTARFQAATDTWRDVAWLSDQELAAQIRTDQIDILFDLSGHSVGNRLLAFARKPAPIQITWMGYVGTTGLAAMDYLLADRYEIPAGAEPYYGEKVLRMPDGYVCFEPPTEAPAVGPLPALTQDRVTFGCFNNPAKITPAVVRVWAEILRRVPHSVLALLPLEATMPAAHRLQEQLAAHDIAAERLQFWGRASRAELLARYNRVDLALDPFPYGGGLTTCEALWMGVPVITCPGETFSSRHALSHLSNVGCTETIAVDFPHYVELAVTLAHDLPRLAGIRSRLRGQMAASPLCQGRRFAQHWTAVLRQVWHAWCQAASSKTEGQP